MSMLRNFQEEMLPVFNKALQDFVDSIFPDKASELSRIFYYHLGVGEDLKKQGKRIRPLLVLMCAGGVWTDWRLALPAAIAVELIHNFSLIHDDIEDNGSLRRGKQAVWVKWGLAKGVNAGDAMFTAVFRALEGLKENFKADIVMDAVDLISSTCLMLTEGQQLDIGFQDQPIISSAKYEEMISGKTAALLAACCQMGALIGGKSKSQQMPYRDFGRSIGMAFQIYDDWLGVWGDEKETGKTTSGDLIEGKKSMPVLIGLENSERFRERWKKEEKREAYVKEMAEWLREDGVEKEVNQAFQVWTDRAMKALGKMDCSEKVKLALREFANKLIIRNY